MNKKLQEIFQKNAEFEKEAPYNFCDRWCERCVYEKQIRCRLYQDELECKITCIAHGREPDDPEITEEVMKRQYEDVGEKIEEFIDENEIDIDSINEPEFEKIKEHIKFVENNPLDRTVGQYRRKASDFLEKAFSKKETVNPELAYDLETVSWYHTLLPAKLHRALCGFHEPACEGDIALYDAVAQFEICKKAITQSVEALRRINKSCASSLLQIQEMLALIHNIHSRIEQMEESI